MSSYPQCSLLCLPFSLQLCPNGDPVRKRQLWRLSHASCCAGFSCCLFICWMSRTMTARYWLYHPDGPDAALLWDFINGPELHWASKLSSWIHPGNRTPVRGLHLCITHGPRAGGDGGPPAVCLAALANVRLAHDQSAPGVTVGREERPEGRRWTAGSVQLTVVNVRLYSALGAGHVIWWFQPTFHDFSSPTSYSF